MPEWLAVLLLGIIEGVTEFLPVSSTGHLLVAQRWLPRQTDLFNIVIQCGAVVAVLPLFRPRLMKIARFATDVEGRVYGLKVLAAFGITGVGGLLLEKGGFRLPEELLPIAIALLVGGVLFIAIERLVRDRVVREELTWAIVVAVGAAQLVAAVFPGTSRSGATILIMLALGLSRVAATEFTFLVGIPTILAGGALKIFKALHKPALDAPAESWGMVALGVVVSAVVSFVVVKWLLGYVQKNSFVVFGWYRIALAAVVLLLLYFG
ncbi:MAG: undecaprenyl-diphosphate phosphatase [Deltaproteobacteria bacterium]|nr:undecaprenyl-diphosphate phosphatase [Deltaproteobacteria bacterium]